MPNEERSRGRVDLVAVERGIQRGSVRQVFTADELFALVAELRAAREVVEAVKPALNRGDLAGDDWLSVNRAVAAYDKAVRS